MVLDEVSNRRGWKKKMEGRKYNTPTRSNLLKSVTVKKKKKRENYFSTEA